MLLREDRLRARPSIIVALSAKRDYNRQSATRFPLAPIPSLYMDTSCQNDQHNQMPIHMDFINKKNSVTTHVDNSNQIYQVCKISEERRQQANTRSVISVSLASNRTPTSQSDQERVQMSRSPTRDIEDKRFLKQQNHFHRVSVHYLSSLLHSSCDQMRPQKPKLLSQQKWHDRDQL